LGKVTNGCFFDEPLRDLGSEAWARVEATGAVCLMPAHRRDVINALDRYVVAARRVEASSTFREVCEPLKVVAKAGRRFRKVMIELAAPVSPSEARLTVQDVMISAIGTAIPAALRELGVPSNIEANTSPQKKGSAWEKRLYSTLLALEAIAGVPQAFTTGSAPQPSLAKTAVDLRRALDDLQRAPMDRSGRQADCSAHDSAYRAWRSAVKSRLKDELLAAWEDPALASILWPRVLGKEAGLCIECSVDAEGRLRRLYGSSSRTPDCHADALFIRIAGVYRSAGGTVAANKHDLARTTYSPFIRLIYQLLDELELGDELSLPTQMAIYKRADRLKVSGEL